MNFSFPVSLNLHKKKCCVIGGGQVAERKTLNLLTAGAIVQLISPTLTIKLKELASQNNLTWIKEEFSFKLFEDCFLVIAATNNRQTNQAISKYCRENNILVNVVDSIEESTFIVNSYIKQGDLMVAVSTNGKSPALSKKIKEELKEIYGPEYRILLDLLGEIRILAKQIITDEKKRNKFFKNIIDEEILDLIRSGCIEEARERVIQCLLSY